MSDVQASPPSGAGGFPIRFQNSPLPARIGGRCAIKSDEENGTAGDPADLDADPSQFAPHQKLGGWAVTLLPYLDAQPTYEIWTQDRYPVVRGLEYTAHAAPNLAISQRFDVEGPTRAEQLCFQ